jgi:hypothetical protein
LGNCRAQGGLQRRQSHINDGAVNENHAGAEDCCGQDPRATSCGGFLARTGEYKAFVARSSGDDTHNPFSNVSAPVARHGGNRLPPYRRLSANRGQGRQ